MPDNNDPPSGSPAPAAVLVDPAEQLSELWRQGQRPDVHAFLAHAGELTPTQVLAALRLDQQERWRAGERIPAESYLAPYPILQADPELAVELICGEYLLRDEFGETPAMAEYLRRFPLHAGRLRQQIEFHDALKPCPFPGLTTVRPAPVVSTQLRRAESAAGSESHRPWVAVPGYEILGEVGRGGMGVVYKARHLALNRIVALKMISAGPEAGPDDLARFRGEAEVVARFQHPNIVQIYEISEQDVSGVPRPYFALEYLDGGSLLQKTAGRPQPPHHLAELVAVVAEAVHYAHQRHVVHRDLKPANILLTADGVPKVTDFGLARKLDQSLHPTVSGSILGTPSYMAPEQAAGRTREVGPPADVYALGAILYELLTGRPPFLAETATDVLLQVLSSEPVSPRRLQPRCPRDLETICLTCLEKQPERRYASALALADDLKRFLREEPIRARPPGVLDQFGKFVRRNKVLVGGVATVFLALLLGVAGTSAGLLQARTERDRALKAEHEVRELLAESYEQTARLAMQRGAWRTALTNIDRALKAGRADSVELRLDRVRALCALHEVARAAEELEELSGWPDLGERAGSVLLWQADIRLGRGGDDTGALQVVRQAARKQLSPAERAYAAGLLAETSPEALAHFRSAAREEPFHQRANGMLGLLLILLGHHAEARGRLAFAEAVFPEDPTFKVLHALLEALDGNLPASSALLERTRPQLNDRQVGTARALMELVSHGRQLDVLATGDLKTTIVVLAWKLSLPAYRVYAGFQDLGKPAGNQPPSSLFFPVPPVLVKALAPLPGALRQGDLDVTTKEFSRAAGRHPDGLLYLYLGLKLGEQGRWLDAEKAFLQATEKPSLFTVARLARLGAVLCESKLLQKGPGSARAGVRARAVQNLRQLVRQGTVPAQQAQSLAPVALELNELDLARQIISDWEQERPRDAEARLCRAEMELAAGAYGLAIEAAKQVLQLRANDKRALEILETAVGRLRKQAAAHE